MNFGLYWTYLLQILLCAVVVSGVPGRFPNAHPRSIVPPKVLHPTHPPGHDPLNFDHLIPRSDHSLYFAEKGKTATDPSAFGSLNTTLTRPTVILDHSGHIQNVDCSSNGLTICFSNDLARKTVQESWNLQDESSPVIVSPHFPGCGRYYQGERTYWQVMSLQLEYTKKGCIRVKTKEVAFPSIIQEGNLRFGHFEAVHDQSHVAALHDVADISNNEGALGDFFGESPSTSFIDTTPASQQLVIGGIGPVSYFSLGDIGNFFHKAVKTIGDGLSTVGKGIGDIARAAVGAVKSFGKGLGKLISDALHYEWSLSDSHSWSYNIGTSNTLLSGLSPIFGAGSGLLLAGDSTLSGKLQFDNCYAKGSFEVTGDIAFSLGGGVDKAELDIGLDLDSRLAISMTLQDKVKLVDYKKEIFAWNLLELEIPGVISVGPQLSLNAVVELHASEKATIEVGGSLKIDHARAKLDLKKVTGSIEGLNPKFTPIANAKGASTSITLSFGLPLGLELGIDAFGGKWKAEVGLYDKVSADATAEAAAKEDCPGFGIDLAVKNSIYLGIPGNPSAYIIDDRNLWSKQLMCINASTTAFDTLGFAQFDTLLSGNDDVEVLYVKKPKTTDLQDPFTRVGGMQGKMFTDINQTAALYVGKEDRLYLVPAHDPTIADGASFQHFPDISESLFIRDGYGGFLNIDRDEIHGVGISSLRSSRLTQMPTNAIWITLLEVAAGEPGEPSILVALDKELNPFNLVACHVPQKGVRVYLVPIGAAEDVLDQLSHGRLDKFIGAESPHCQPLYLTSHTTGFKIDH